jgi:hypothetical protein
MNSPLSTTARATDERHIELTQPLQNVPASLFRVLLFLDPPSPLPAADRVADFLAWASRPRPGVGLRDAGRDTIYED